MLSAEQSQTLQSADIRTIDPDILPDIQSVRVDAALPVEKRLEQYLRQVPNPYLFRCGGAVVKIGFQPGGESLENTVSSMLSRLKGRL